MSRIILRKNQEILENQGMAEIYACDVSDYDACETFFKTVVQTYGRIDVLVNNAGITRDGLLMKMTEEDYDAVLQTNLKGPFPEFWEMPDRQIIVQQRLVSSG